MTRTLADVNNEQRQYRNQKSALTKAIRSKDPNIQRADAALQDLTDSHWLNRKHAIEVLGGVSKKKTKDLEKRNKALPNFLV